ncbi:DNA polymerase-3 subunit gamma/tau [Streptomyces radiopugnans]|uniref:DNA polymerase III subunit gamma/tau n=1 Tax=Streptomyces radiopugnans TaxID=403935 RepID=A0A1H9CLR9_9ACTN|nr:DNA polymerase-3 subunit gamma/tau [Streptomyces radiopugnans]
MSAAAYIVGDVSSLALYRRYRPEAFSEVIGQEHVTDPLQQALRNNRVNHAYLFSGPRGCGKTTSARILARCLNCEKGPTPDPCGECRSCLDLARNGPGSIDVIEIDAASHGGVDDARDLREKAFFGPASSRYKIYIIDEAHMVTPQGFNALLKVVEEPPEHLKFIFATTEPEKVIGTIRSRTHHYPFRLVPPGTLRDYLAEVCEHEAIPVEDGVLPLVVRAGAGSVRDSMSVMDQLLAGAGPDGVTYAMATALLGYTDGALLDSVVDAFAAGDGAAAFEVVDRVIEGGHDPRRFVADLLERLRDLVILAAVPDAGEKGLIDAPADVVEKMTAQASVFGPAELSRAADIVNEGLTAMRGATSPRLQLELICARVLLPAAYGDERSLQARLDRLERGASLAGGLAAGAGAVGAGPVGGAPVGAPPAPGGGPAEAGTALAGQQGAPAPQGPSPAQPAARPAPESGPAPDAGRRPGAWPAAAPGGGQTPGGGGQGEPQARPGAWPGQQPAQPAQPPAQPQDDGRRPGAWPTPASAPTAPAASTPQPQAQAPAPPVQAPAAPQGGADGGQGAAQVRQMWPGILDAVKGRRRFTWILLSQNAHVAGFDGTTLRLGFSNQGARDSFANGGSEDVLRAALADAFGVQWRIESVVDPSGGSAPPQGQSPQFQQSAQASQSPHSPHSSGGPGGFRSAAVAAPPAAQPPSSAPYGQQQPARPQSPQSQPQPSRPQGPQAPGPYGEADPPPPPPVAPEDDMPAEDDPDLDDTALSGHDLIVRELGATVLEELYHE